MKRILYFGIYDPHYIRNSVIMRGFEQNGFKVVECRVNPSEMGGLKKYVALYRRGKKLRSEDFSYVVVGFPGASVVLLARFLFGKRVIFDAFMSQFDSNVLDREEYGRWSIRGRRDWLYDWYSIRLAWRVLLPERVHIDFFLETFGGNPKKFIRVFTGADDSIFYPRPDVAKAEAFTAHFHGNFIPLQGVQHIIEAARILRDEPIRFQIVGAGGSLFRSIERKVAELKLENVDMVGRKPLEDIPNYIARAHVCLGVFGDTEKAKRVISNKVYEYLAVGAPVITARTPAMEELLTDRETVLFCNSSDGADMAEKILELRDNSELRGKIARGGNTLYNERLTPAKLVGRLLIDLETRA